MNSESISMNLEEYLELIGACTNLATQNRVTVFVADADGELLGMLVNGEIKHSIFLVCLIQRILRLRQTQEN